MLYESLFRLKIIIITRNTLRQIYLLPYKIQAIQEQIKQPSKNKQKTIL